MRPLARSIDTVAKEPTDSIGFHVVVPIVSLAISCLQQSDGHCRGEVRVGSKSGEPSVASLGYNRPQI